MGNVLGSLRGLNCFKPKEAKRTRTTERSKNAFNPAREASKNLRKDESPLNSQLGDAEQQDNVDRFGAHKGLTQIIKQRVSDGSIKIIKNKSNKPEDIVNSNIKASEASTNNVDRSKESAGVSKTQQENLSEQSSKKITNSSDNNTDKIAISSKLETKKSVDSKVIPPTEISGLSLTSQFLTTETSASQLEECENISRQQEWQAALQDLLERPQDLQAELQSTPQEIQDERALLTKRLGMTQNWKIKEISLKRIQEIQDRQKQLDVIQNLQKVLAERQDLQTRLQNLQEMSQDIEAMYQFLEDLSGFRLTRKLDGFFRKIGGNTEIADAKLICLGEGHVDDIHYKQTIQLINSVAKDGNIILIEEAQAEQEVKKEDWLHARAQVLTSVFKSQEEITSFLESLPSLSKNVRVFGWGAANPLLEDAARETGKKELQLHNEIEQAKKAEERERVSTLTYQLESVKKEMLIGVRQRNKSLVDTIDKMRQKFPNETIFIIAGELHFTRDSILINNLEKQPYIVLKPIHELSKKETLERANKFHKYLNDMNYDILHTQ